MWILQCHLHINNSSKNLVNVLLHTLFYTYNPNIYTYLNALWAVYFSKKYTEGSYWQSISFVPDKSSLCWPQPLQMLLYPFHRWETWIPERFKLYVMASMSNWMFEEEQWQTASLHDETYQDPISLPTQEGQCHMLMFWCDPKIPSVTSGPGGHQKNHQ